LSYPAHELLSSTNWSKDADLCGHEGTSKRRSLLHVFAWTSFAPTEKSNRFSKILNLGYYGTHEEAQKHVIKSPRVLSGTPHDPVE